MKKIQFKIYFILSLAFLLIIISCSKKEESVEVQEEQLNISILIDLSDRITTQIAPYQVERDIEIIKSVVGLLKNKIRQRGTFSSEDRMNFIFYPQPDDSNIGAMATVLNFDMGKLSPPDRKLLYQNIDSIYNLNLNNLYQMALNQKNFDGSDIWRFFKDEVNEKCIVDKPNFKNILIILTDGYIYWKNSMHNEGNRFTYILPTSQHLTKFRSNNSWEQEFEKNDYGLIPANKNLSNLKVLVLEVNPPTTHPDDYDIIKKYLGKWFVEMGIEEGNYKILKTDLSVYTKPIVEAFISK